ncbi:MAG: hypothetical protein C5B51_09060 [Terriglobia bacterium]|nr:MAG: hypothetical protein C5B51_09060 [Terriglobia bacterium]
MFASILITGVSLVLLVYWFRYSCLLLLRTKTEQSLTVPGSHFSFLDMRRRLHTEANVEPLLRSLERDYQVLTYLLRHSRSFGSQSLEDRLLILDYKCMQLWYRVTRTVAPQQARRAASEMAGVLACLAHKMGAQTRLQN